QGPRKDEPKTIKTVLRKDGNRSPNVTGRSCQQGGEVLQTRGQHNDQQHYRHCPHAASVLSDSGGARRCWPKKSASEKRPDHARGARSRNASAFLCTLARRKNNKVIKLNVISLFFCGEAR